MIQYVILFLTSFYLQTSNAVPIAIHQLVVVNASGSAIVRIRGYDEQNPNLLYKILSPTTSGSLYQLSQVFSNYGYSPVYGTKITSDSVVTGSQNRVYYSRPSRDIETNSRWDVIYFDALSGTAVSNTKSYTGMITFVPPTGVLVGSDFLLSNEEWGIVGNKNSRDLANYERYTRGSSFSNYIFGEDNKINLDSVGKESSLWYFDAPSKFYGNFGLAYGGFLSFSMLSFSGDMSDKNGIDVPLVILECGECNGPISKGLRLVYPISSVGLSVFKTTPYSFNLQLKETSGWLKDSQNTLSPWMPVTQCDIIQVLSRLSSLRILGDWTKWYETMALDNVKIYNLKSQLPLCAMARTDASICTC